MKNSAFFTKNLYVFKMANRLENNELADMLGSTPQTIGRWLLENKTPPTPTVNGIAMKLNVDPDDLLNKDLTLYFLKSSGMLPESEMLIAADPGQPYGDSMPKAWVRQQLKGLSDAMRSVMNEVDRTLAEVEK